jgi:PAS domain S-box-containing protein
MSAVPAEVASMLEALPDAAFLLGRDKRLLRMNAAAAALTGLERQAAVGRPCAAVVRCDACDARCPFDRVVEDGRAVATPSVTLEGPGGAVTAVLHTAPLDGPGGETVAVLEQVRLVDPPRAAVERGGPLEHEREPVQAVLDSVAEGVFTVDEQRVVTSVNRSAVQMLGRPESQLVGRRCWEVLGCAAGAADACPVPRAALDEGRRLTNFETEYRDRGGRPLPVSLSVSPLEWGGQRHGAVEVFRDLRAHATVAPADVALVVGSPRMRRVMELVDVLKDSDATVLLQGESGTGKGIIAALIHRLGSRAHQAFVKVNCAALPESLLESELFGHVKGAFTGAVRDTVGRFELADGGTIFLDEVGELSLATQVKLLRVLQEQEFERVGSAKTQYVDVRVIAATNRDLGELMAQGHFRADLYYRLNVIPIELPPLRERREDIPALVEHILARLAGKGRKVKAVTPEVMDALLEHVWPGNIRELENTLEHAVVCSKGSVIELSALPRAVVACAGAVVPDRGAPRRDERLLEALASHHGNRSAAARALGVNRTTVWRRLKRLGPGQPSGA